MYIYGTWIRSVVLIIDHYTYWPCSTGITILFTWPQQQQQQQHPIYYGPRLCRDEEGPRLRRDGEGPLHPIEWVRRDQKIRTGCAPRGELNSQQGDHVPMVQKRSGRPMPVSGPRYHDAQDYRKSPQPQQQLSHQSREHNNNNNNNDKDNR